MKEIENITYLGKRNNSSMPQKIIIKIMYIDGTIEIEELLHINKHSLDGFEWGYSGSGPSDLALSILTDFCKRYELMNNIPEKFYQEFKLEIVSHLDDKFELSGHEVGKWIDRKMEPLV
jgi:hypothetical protein